ncbi:PAS domain-containing protein [Sinorhizobium meliloti]|nr:PAS domain-containing protein [Sinorhizobium meliloti]RVK41625.1 PAS domain-containing protein [Sinorhizobium meliloti]
MCIGRSLPRLCRQCPRHNGTAAGRTCPGGERSLDPSVFESTPDCIRLLDIDGRPLLMNRAGRQLFGLDENATLEDVAWRDLVHRSAEGPDDACRNGDTGQRGFQTIHGRHHRPGVRCFR